jgi:uncharacterized membrane protein YfhO
LLLNERTGPNWQVSVDNKPAKLLRCNYFVRGVYVDKGEHTVEFKFRPPLGSLFVSLAGMGIGLLVAGFVIVTNRGRKNDDDETDLKTTPAGPRVGRLSEK